MLKYPEFYDIRKSAIILAIGPFAFLSLVILVDLSSHLFVTQQTASVCLRENAAKLQVNECR